MQLAQIQNKALDSGIRDIRGAVFLSKLIPTLITVVFIIGSVLFVFMLLTGGVQWITAQGDKTAAEGARSKITQALTGIIILFGAYAIFKAIESIFGITFLSIDIGSFGVSQ